MYYVYCVGPIPYRYSYFGNGPGPNIISNLYCYTGVNSLLDCSYSLIDAARYCGDGAVAGVICEGKK